MSAPPPDGEFGPTDDEPGPADIALPDLPVRDDAPLPEEPLGDEGFPGTPLRATGRAFRPTGRSSVGRVPPHNLDAEASLLGAMLLSWHNLHYYQDLMADLRRAVNESALAAFEAAFHAEQQEAGSGVTDQYGTE